MTESSVARKLRTVLTLLRLAPAYMAFTVLKRRLSLQRLASVAWKDSARRPRRPHEEARIVACVVRLHQLLGGRDDDCVPRSLLLYREFSRLGADPRLCIGFKPAETELLGHAWVEVDGRIVGEADLARAGFSKQLTFGKGGHWIEEPVGSPGPSGPLGPPGPPSDL